MAENVSHTSSGPWLGPVADGAYRFVGVRPAESEPGAVESEPPGDAVVVNTQAELDQALADGVPLVHIIVPKAAGNPPRFLLHADHALETQVEARGAARVVATKKARIVARDNAEIQAYDYARVTCYDNSTVTASGHVVVQAHDASTVEGYDSSRISTESTGCVELYDDSYAMAYGAADVAAYGNSRVLAREDSTVKLYDSAECEAFDNASVDGYHTSRVEMYSNSVAIILHGSATCGYRTDADIFPIEDDFATIEQNARNALDADLSTSKPSIRALFAERKTP